ncbi:MAG TPA: VOC family protein [Terriglobales bacterium]|jgi:catechol 2,3-dioxygenase-like lactoylglutathione lyase family enzyme
MKFRFDCVFYYVTNVEAAIRFYRDVLGFKLTSRDVVARFDIDGIRFELVPATTKPRGPGNARLCLGVDSVEQALKDLRAHGVRTGVAVDKGTGALASFEDPDGNQICLWEYPKKEAP